MSILPESIPVKKALAFMQGKGYQFIEYRRDPGSGERFYVFHHVDRPTQELSMLTCELRAAHRLPRFHHHPRR